MRHALVCRPDNAGDVLLSGPAVRAVASLTERLTFLCGPNGEEAARLLPGVDEVISFRAPWIDPGPAPVDRGAIDGLISDLVTLQPTHALILSSFHQSPLPLALILRMAGVPTIAGISDDYPGSLLDVRHRVGDQIHEVERNLSLAATLGCRLPAGDDGRLRVRPTPPWGEAPPGDYVVVHPGASAPARTASPAHFEEVAHSLVDDGWWVVVTGSKAERSLTHQVAGRKHGIVDLGGSTSMVSLASVLRQASAVVTGNTGPAHLAAAVETPVVQLFAPTVPPVRWRPWAVPHVLLGDLDIGCAGCRARQCPIPGQPCLGRVAAAEVVDAVRQVVSQPDPVNPAIAVGRVVA